MVKLFTRIARLWTARYPDSVADERSIRLDVPLPEDLRAFVDAQAAHEGFASPAEYVAELVRRAKVEADLEAEGPDEEHDEELEQLLLEGLDSGPGIEVTPEYVTKKRAEWRERHRGKAAE